MNVLSKLKSLFASTKGRVDLDKRFQLIAPIAGQGSMSKLWRARDLMSGRTVALKVLDMTKVERQIDRMARAYGSVTAPSEGEVTMLLRHPNVVQTYDHGISTKREQFLVMEFIEGVGLNFLIETKAPALTGKRIHFLGQAADALAFVHEKGFIHRDVCPRNLMVTPEGVVKLIDFGLAVPNKPEFRRPGNRAGTANYMAPELIKRAPTDEKVDVFAFGVTAYECIVGTFPWDAADTIQRLRQHMNAPPRDPKLLRRDIDNELADLLLRSIARQPADRVPSMAAFVQALRSLERKDY